MLATVLGLWGVAANHVALRSTVLGAVPTFTSYPVDVCLPCVPNVSVETDITDVGKQQLEIADGLLVTIAVPYALPMLRKLAVLSTPLVPSIVTVEGWPSWARVTAAACIAGR